jgi:hypothetical protein
MLIFVERGKPENTEINPGARERTKEDHSLCQNGLKKDVSDAVCIHLIAKLLLGSTKTEYGYEK